MKSKIISILMVLLLTFGCIPKNTEEEKSTEMQPTNTFFSLNVPELMNNKREVQLSEIADTIEYVPLETSQKSLLGPIRDAKITKDYIFIAAWKEPLTQFDRSGKFIRRIGRIGRGPEEYIMIREFSIDEEHRKIYIQSNYNRSIQVYSFDGEHLESIVFTEDYGSIVWSRDSLLMCFDEPTRGIEENIFEERNSKGEILQTVKNHFFWQNNSDMSYMAMYSERNMYYRLNNRLHLKGWYNDTIYTYDNFNKIVPKYFIDLGSTKLPEMLRTEVTGKIVSSPQYYWASSKESDRFIFIVYSTYAGQESRPAPLDHGLIIFDKQNNDGNLCIDMLLFNDLNGGPNFYPEFINDSIAFGFESASRLKKFFETEDQQNTNMKKQELKKILRTKFKGLDESDNPVIVLAKLKSEDK